MWFFSFIAFFVTFSLHIIDWQVVHFDHLPVVLMLLLKTVMYNISFSNTKSNSLPNAWQMPTNKWRLQSRDVSEGLQSRRAWKSLVITSATQIVAPWTIRLLLYTLNYQVLVYPKLWFISNGKMFISILRTTC